MCSISTDDQTAFAPEMLHYNVDTVPCFVALNSKGRAVAKSGKPRGVQHMQQTLDALSRILLKH